MKCDKVFLGSNTGYVYFKGQRVGVLSFSETKILNFLLMKNGDPASKDELIAAGWPNRVTVPNSLNMSIKKIRSIFATIGYDDIIITVPRVGFCLPTPSVIEIIQGEIESESVYSEPLQHDNNQSNRDSISSSFLSSRKFLTLTLTLTLTLILVFLISYRTKKPMVFATTDINLIHSESYCNFFLYGEYDKNRMKTLKSSMIALSAERDLSCNETPINLFFYGDGYGKSRARVELFSACYLGKDGNYIRCENFRSIYGK